jgi:hypothetical protein
MRIKLFRGYDIASLERDVNQFLGTHKVVDVKITTHGGDDGATDPRTFIMVSYEGGKEEQT